MVDRPEQHEGGHPTPFTYAKVASILVTLTAIEFGVFYLDFPNVAMVAIFLILSAIKFVLVILFYMHLKFDNRLFSGLFVGGLLLAVAVSVGLMALFQVLGALANPSEIDGEHSSVVEVPHGELTEAMDGVDVSTCTVADSVCQGRELFIAVPDSAAPQALWCSACHALGDVSSGMIGPDLTNIGIDAGNRIAGVSAEAYIRESITNPGAFIPEGVTRANPGLMTNTITEDLTSEQIDLLVAFLLNPIDEEVTLPSDAARASTAVATPVSVVEQTVSDLAGGDLEAEGEDLFINAPSNVGVQALWCSQCHTVGDVAAGAIGPDLSHIGTDAAGRISGMSAEVYITEAIGQPEAFVAEGVDRAIPGLMTTAIVQNLTDRQIAALAAFLLSQK